MSQEQISIQNANRKTDPTGCLIPGSASIWNRPVFAAIKALVPRDYLAKFRLLLLVFMFALFSSSPIRAAAPEITLSTTSIDIGDVAVGNSGTGIFTITNDGGAALNVTSISSDNAEFSVAPASAAIPGGQNQVVTVTFTPSASGSQSATLTIASNDSDEGTLTVSVSGNGIVIPAPEISLSASDIAFGNVTLGTSGQATFTITNEGNDDLVVSNISSDNGNFSLNPASASIPPGQNQVVTVTFTPSSAGFKSATITINSNDSDEGTLTVSASGNGIMPPAPEISLSTTSISFGEVSVGSSSPATFTITNAGGAALVVSSIISDNAEFSAAPNSATIPPGQNQVVTITFTPGSVGSKSATITITSDDSDEGTLTLSASGNGTAPPAPEITLSATSISLGDVTVGSSGSATFTIINEGDADLVVGDIISNNGEFIPSPVSAIIPSGQNQVVTVTFSPSSTGSRSATITITSNDSDEGTLTLSASGNGAAPPAPEISLSTASISLGDVTVGSSGSATFTITNEGNADLIVSNISSDNAEFSVAPASATLPGGQNQVVTITFTPGSVGSKSAAITITNNDPDEGTLTLSASGNGTAPPAPEIALSITNISIGNVTVGTSGTGIFTIFNEGNAALKVTSISSDNAEFSVDPDSATIPGGKTQAVTVTFTPGSIGSRSAAIAITSNDSDEGYLTVSVGANGVLLPALEPDIAITREISSGSASSPSTTVPVQTVDFGEVSIGSSSQITITIANVGESTLFINSLYFNRNSSIFTLSGEVTSLLPGASKKLELVFSPLDEQSYKERLNIISNDPDEGTVSISLIGSGIVSPDINVSQSTISFESTAIGTTDQKTFTINNSGSANLIVYSIASDNEMFSVNPEYATIVAGQSLDITLTFRPYLPGIQSATITLTTNDSDEGTLYLKVTGTGVEPAKELGVSLSDYSVHFGEVTLGGSFTDSLTIANEGNVDFVITQINSDNESFSVSPDHATVAPGQSLSVTVTFSPSSAGSQSAVITIFIYNDSEEETLTVTLSGNGTEPLAPEISLSGFIGEMSDIEIGDVTVGSILEHTFNIANKGDGDLLVTSIILDNPAFSIAPNSAAIAPGETQTVTVTFNPNLVTGTHSTMVTVLSNDSDESRLTFGIICNCIDHPAPGIALSTTSIDFGDVPVGNSATGILSITNEGDADLLISGISIDNDMFSISPEPATLAANTDWKVEPGASLEVELRFDPSSAGIQNANITITSNGFDEETLTVSVSGNGILQPVPEIKLSTTYVDLGSVAIGGTGSGIIKITNDGDADLVIADISSDNELFIVSPDSATIKPGQTETVTVTFKPNLPGAQNAGITIVSNDPDNAELIVRVSCSEVVALSSPFSLSQNSPNPFNPSTTISYSVPEGASGKIALKIFDLRGRLLHVLMDRVCTPGTYSVTWDGRDRSGRPLPSGIYLYRFEAGNFVQTRKMVMLK